MTVTLADYTGQSDRPEIGYDQFAYPVCAPVRFSTFHHPGKRKGCGGLAAHSARHADNVLSRSADDGRHFYSSQECIAGAGSFITRAVFRIFVCTVQEKNGRPRKKPLEKRALFGFRVAAWPSYAGCARYVTSSLQRTFAWLAGGLFRRREPEPLSVVLRALPQL